MGSFLEGGCDKQVGGVLLERATPTSEWKRAKEEVSDGLVGSNWTMANKNKECT